MDPDLLVRPGRIMRFRLRKWYLDCVTEEGETAIVYVGRVSYGWLRVSYAERIVVSPGTPPTRMRRLSGRAVVRSDRTEVTLAAPVLGAAGRWVPGVPALAATLLDSADGEIEWRCHQPAGAAAIRLPAGVRLVGQGYVEELSMSAPPWALPFHELRWGRFLDAQGLVWIDWRGGVNRHWLFRGGAPLTGGRIEDDVVEWPGGRLDLDRRRTVREACVGRTVAGSLAWILPRRIRCATESKWLSLGTLSEDGRAGGQGWVIHEVVRWP